MDKKFKIPKNYTTTLDAKHNECVNQFAKNDGEVIPQLKQERKELVEQLNLLLSKTGIPTTAIIDQKMDLEDRIQDITKQIKQLKRKKQDYFLDNSKYIFEYFENKKSIDNNTDDGSTLPSTASSSKPMTSKSQILFNIFKIKKQDNDQHSTERETENKTKNIVQRYLSNVDDSFLDINSFVRETDICQSCRKGEMIPIEDEGVLLCNNCCVNIPYLVENEKTSYKEPPKEACFYAYQRINHFKEILAQFQAKETTQIPDHVIDEIKMQIKKQRLNLSDLTYHVTKEILKNLEFNKYYEHIAFIKNKLGIKPPIFTPELEETLCNLFIEIQPTYAQVCPDCRINFLHYYYVLYQFCVLLDKTQYLDEIPLLKDREKLIEQDEIWKKMCIELDWEFIPAA